MRHWFLEWLDRLRPLTTSTPITEIGILTLAKTDDTPAFRALRQGLPGKEGKDFSLHFRFAADDTELGSLAAQLLRIPNIALIVTGGTKALQEVNARRIGPLANVKIVQAVGGNPVPNDPNITGFHIDRLQTCQDQVDHLIKKYSPGSVSILVDDHTTNPDYAPLAAYAVGKGLTVNPPVDAPTPAALTAANFSTVAGSFMLIPNGMFFDNCTTIAQLVDGKNLPKIYPERAYKDAHLHPAQVIAHGHKIPETYKRAAVYVSDFLQGTKDTATEAPDTDIDS
jgi:hypothetical protein